MISEMYRPIERGLSGAARQPPEPGTEEKIPFPKGGLIKKLKARQTTVACRALFDSVILYDTFGESACGRVR